VVAGALLSASVVHVGEGEVGLLRGRAIGPGWHLRAPLTTVVRVPASGHLDGIEATVTTPEGASLPVRLSFDYRLDAARLSFEPLAGRPGGEGGAGGAPAPLTALLSHEIGRALALEAAAGKAALPPAAAAVPLPDAFVRSVTGRLQERGIAIASASGTIGGAAATAAASAAAGTGGGTGAGASGPMPQRDATGLRVLLIGLDGADWDLIDPLVRAGKLPHLKRLMDEGVRGPLRSYDPMISPLLWTTIVTGVGPDRHGVADFQAVEQPSGRRVPITSRFRKVKALWNILGDAGMTSAFVAWWASYPAEPVRGFQVSNLLAFESLRPRAADKPWPAGIVWPSDYLRQRGSLLKTAADLSDRDIRSVLHLDDAALAAARREVLKGPDDAVPGGRKAVQDPAALAISILAGSANYARVATDLAARHADLTGVYFEGIDMMGHRFQHCMPPRMALCPEADFARFQDAVTGFYAYQDRLLGTILDAAGPRTTVLVVSDHGFRSGADRPQGALPYTTEQPVEWHDRDGVFLLSGPGARRGARLSARPTLFDIAKTLLELVGLPASDEMPGRVIAEALDPVFLARHPARRIPSYETVGTPLRRDPASADPAAREAEAELLASLRSLGYIGGDEGKSEAAAGGAGGGGTGAAAEDTQVFYHRNLATYFLKRRDYERAIEELRLANARQPLPKTDEMLAEAYLGLGRPQEAQAALKSLLGAHADLDPEPVLWLVRLAADSGGAAAGRTIATEYAPRTARKPGLDDAIGGLLLETDGKRDEALAAFRRSLQADPSRAFVAERLLALESPAGRAALRPALQRAVAADPKSDAAWNLLGTVEAEAGHGAAAVDAFRRAADLAPDDARYAANLGAACARQERWGEAAEAYERAMNLEPTVPSALRLGSVYRRLRRPQQALAAFTRARDLGDATPATWLGMALSLDAIGRREEALRAVDAGLAKNPGEPSLTRLRNEIAARAPAPPPAGAGDRPGRSAPARPGRRGAPHPGGRAPRRRLRGRARAGAARAPRGWHPAATGAPRPPAPPPPAPARVRPADPAPPARG
jgi:tetratricopeptide (TPR) repeat protein/arylsulfatase A-like enzyme